MTAEQTPFTPLGYANLIASQEIGRAVRIHPAKTAETTIQVTYKGKLRSIKIGVSGHAHVFDAKTQTYFDEYRIIIPFMSVCLAVYGTDNDADPMDVHVEFRTSWRPKMTFIRLHTEGASFAVNLNIDWMCGPRLLRHTSGEKIKNFLVDIKDEFEKVLSDALRYMVVSDILVECDRDTRELDSLVKQIETFNKKIEASKARMDEIIASSPEHLQFQFNERTKRIRTQ